MVLDGEFGDSSGKGRPKGLGSHPGDRPAEQLCCTITPLIGQSTSSLTMRREDVDFDRPPKTRDGEIEANASEAGKIDRELSNEARDARTLQRIAQHRLGMRFCSAATDTTIEHGEVAVQPAASR